MMALFGIMRFPETLFHTKFPTLPNSIVGVTCLTQDVLPINKSKVVTDYQCLV